MLSQHARKRPLIAFFDYPDVFEDFYPHYGVDQQNFATHWAATGNHSYLKILQSEVGDIVWYSFSLKPELSEARHEVVGCQVRMLSSSLLHRCLWRAFYMHRASWRLQFAYPFYSIVASYVALPSRSLIRTLKHDRPDVFFVQDYATGRYDVLLLVARILGVPLIAYHSGSVPERYVGRVAKHWTIPRADMLIASSQAELEMLASRYRVPRERITVILTPIDTDIYHPLDRKAACSAAGLARERRYLLYMGRLDDNVKRVSALIRAFATMVAEHRDVDLLIAGDGSDREKLQRLAAECVPDRIRFLGWISEVELKSQLYTDGIAATIDPFPYQSFIQASKAELGFAQAKYSETYSGWFSDRTQCYLSTGRPALVRDTGFCKILPCGEGLLVFEDEEGILAGMDEIESDYARHSRRAREIAEEYVVADKVVRNLLQTVGLL